MTPAVLGRKQIALEETKGLHTEEWEASSSASGAPFGAERIVHRHLDWKLATIIYDTRRFSVLAEFGDTGAYCMRSSKN